MIMFILFVYKTILLNLLDCLELLTFVESLYKPQEILSSNDFTPTVIKKKIIVSLKSSKSLKFVQLFNKSIEYNLIKDFCFIILDYL